jgi:hypothetical protein
MYLGMATMPDGMSIVALMPVYSGEIAEGERLLAPFREAGPIADMVQPMPYPALYPPDEEGYHPTGTAHTMFVDTIDHSAAEAIIAHLRAATAPMAVTQLRVLGGAMARVPVEATAFAHRRSRIMVNVAAIYERPDEAPQHAAWVNGLAAALRQDDGGAYVNFLGEEGADRVRAAYPGATWDRLAAIKARYDPTNLFHVNHNIPPAGARGADQDQQ